MTGCMEVGVPRGQPPDAAQVLHILPSRGPAVGSRRGADLGMRSRVPAGKVAPRLAHTGSRACTHRPGSPRGSRQDRRDWEELVPTRSPSPLPVWWGVCPPVSMLSPLVPFSSPRPPGVSAGGFLHSPVRASVSPPASQPPWLHSLLPESPLCPRPTLCIYFSFCVSLSPSSSLPLSPPSLSPSRGLSRGHFRANPLKRPTADPLGALLRLCPWN